MTYATQARTLDDIAADNHVFSIIAMDQRNTLRRMFTAVGSTPATTTCASRRPTSPAS